MKKVICTLLALTTLILPLSGCKRAVGGGSEYIEYNSYYYDTNGDSNQSNTDSTGNIDITGNSPNTTGSKDSNGNTTSSVTSDTTTEKEYNSTEIKDVPSTLKNPNITLISWYDPGSSDKTTAFYHAVQKYQELYGANTVKLITTSGETGYKERVIAMMAGGDAPELMEVKTAWMPTWAIDKLVQPVDGIIEYQKLHYQGLIKATEYAGKHYVACPNGMWSSMIWYNKDLFKKYGVKTPMEYYESEDGWTWDAFRTASKDIYEASGHSVYGFSTEALDIIIRSQKNGLVLRNENGKYVNNMKSAEVSNALSLMSKMIYEDKSWNPDLTAAKTQFNKKKIAMSAATIGFYQNYCKGLSYDSIDVVPLPKPTKSADYYCGAYGIFWSLGKDSDNLDGAVAFMKILAQYEDTDYGNRTPLEQVLTDKQLQLTRTMSEKAGIVEHLSLSWDPYEFWKDISTANKPVATVISEYYNEVDAAIAKINK